MSIRKHLIKLALRIEKTWKPVDLDTKQKGGVSINGGWYVSEFNVQGPVQHIPDIIVLDHNSREIRRSLIGFHSGRNRMMFYLPAGKITAYDNKLQFDFLSRVSELEGRARVLLISFRYLADFFSIKSLFKIITMQFLNRFDLSTNLLQFYAPSQNDLYYEINRWKRLKGFNWILKWLTKGVKIAVLIENEEQRKILDEQLVKPDQVLILGNKDRLQSDIDYLIPLSKTEQLRQPAIAVIKRAIKLNDKKPAIIYSDHDFSVANSGLTAESKTKIMEPVYKPQPSLAYLHCFNYIGPAVIFNAKKIASASLSDLMSDEKRYRLSVELFQESEGAMQIPEALFVSHRNEDPETPQPFDETSSWPNIDWRQRENYNVLTASVDWRDQPSVDLIIPTRDRLDMLKPCVQSILEKTDYKNFYIYIVDNNSEEAETHEYLTEIGLHERVTVIDYPGEFNYSAINNLAAAKGKSDYIALINNDVEVIHADWLTQMMVWVIQPNVGIVGAKLVYSNGNIQHAGVTIGIGNAAGHIHRLADGDSSGYQNRLVATQNMMAVTAACLITPRSLFNELGGLDEEVLKVAYNDVDYCLKVEQRGLEVIWTPEATLYHHESVSRGDDMSEKHIERYFYELGVLQKRWKTKGFVDKYYSKHLRITDEGVYPQVFLSDPGEMHRLDC